MSRKNGRNAVDNRLKKLRKSHAYWPALRCSKNQQGSFFDSEDRLRMFCGCFPDHLRIIFSGVRVVFWGAGPTRPKGAAARQWTTDAGDWQDTRALEGAPSGGGRARARAK